jgi:2-polyprenyl-3-methyl-5-hydroxy-6-metoxy-1,4-benzoquinol methylase
VSTPTIDEAKLEAFMGVVVQDMGAAISTLMNRIGDRCGLYRAMAHAGPMTSEQLAERSGCDERYVREWLANQAAGGYLSYDAAAGTFTLPDEHALALAEENSPAFIMGGYDFLASVWADEEKFVEMFKTGEGVGWHEHDPRLYSGTERFFRPGYQAHLVAEWIPALEGVEAKLRAGARVADVGCGHGASTVIMAAAYPESRFVGIDYHEPSIARAKEMAAEEGVADRCEFVVGTAQEFAGSGFDLVCNFDCLHDMGDPVGAARHAREAMADDGTYMVVEPNAGDTLSENLHPVGRMFYAGSTMICTPCSKAQPVGLALGAQAGPARLTEILNEAGFSRVRSATATPFNLVLEARR